LLSRLGIITACAIGLPIRLMHEWNCSMTPQIGGRRWCVAARLSYAVFSQMRRQLYRCMQI